VLSPNRPFSAPGNDDDASGRHPGTMRIEAALEFQTQCSGPRLSCRIPSESSIRNHIHRSIGRVTSVSGIAGKISRPLGPGSSMRSHRSMIIIPPTKRARDLPAISPGLHPAGVWPLGPVVGKQGAKYPVWANLRAGKWAIEYFLGRLTRIFFNRRADRQEIVQAV